MEMTATGKLGQRVSFSGQDAQGVNQSTPDPERAADVSPHESDLWLRIYGLDSDMAPSVSPFSWGLTQAGVH